jgi:hypothetical protein
VGVDNTWEQKKIEARKMLEKPQNRQRPVYALLICFFQLNGISRAIILPQFIWINPQNSFLLAPKD